MTGGPTPHSSISPGFAATNALIPMLVRKELRALAPVFAATAVLVPLCRLGLENELMTIGLGVYVLGATALGALSIGHEYTHDTLGQLLAQPGRRTRLLTVKLLVLAALLGLLAATATVTVWPWIERSFVGVGYGDEATALRWPVVLIPVLLAAFVAPLLTMLSRSVLAGTVFTVGIYAGLWLIAPGVTSPSFPEDGVDIGFYAGTMLWIAIGVSALSAIAGAVMFSRLEFTGSHSAMAWTASRRVGSNSAQAVTSRHPAVALLLKELRLQTVSFAVAGLYGMVWALVPLFGRESPERAYVFETVTVLFQVVLAMLIGAVASAEERGLGTLQWHTLQPYAQWKQWAIKAGTALTLSVLLVIVLPAALQAISPRGSDTFVIGLQLPTVGSQVIVRPQIWAFAAGVLALTAGALFVSSLTRSSLHALLTTPLLIPVIAVATGISYRVGGIAAWRALELNTLVYGAARGWRVTRWEDSDFLWLERTHSLSVTVAVLGFLFLLLRFGLTNHRSAEVPRQLIARQVVALTAYGVGAATLVGSGYALEVWYLATH